MTSKKIQETLLETAFYKLYTYMEDEFPLFLLE